MKSIQSINRAFINRPVAIILFIAVPFLVMASTVSQKPADLDPVKLLLGLFGGLAIFLYGMEKMSEALKVVAGERMKDILAAFTNNRFFGVVTGAAVTAIIQSSSVTTVLLVGFVTAGLMSLGQTIGVILGANIGTTITAQIIAFKVTKYALLLVAVGFSLLFFSKRERIRQYGYMIMGLGLVFYGMSIMSGAMRPLRSYEPFLILMQQMSNPVLAILVGAVFTALIQSSSATTGVVIVMGMQGLISLEAGIGLALGSNIGTCVTAGLASIGKPREAIRVFIVHTIFNVAGVLLIGALIPWFADLVRAVSPEAASGLTGQEALAAVVPRQIANAHTLFNVTMALLFLPFTTVIAKIAMTIVPEKEGPIAEGPVVEVRYMHDILLQTPSLALEAVRHELQRIGARVMSMLDPLLPAMMTGSREDLDAIAELNEKAHIIRGFIINYLGQISKTSIGQLESEDLLQHMSAVNNLARIGDLIKLDLVGLGQRRIDQNLKISNETQKVLSALGNVVFNSLKITLAAMETMDAARVANVVSAREEVVQLVKKAESHQANRLIADEDKRLATYTLEVEIIDKLKRIHSNTMRLADMVITASGNGNNLNKVA